MPRIKRKRENQLEGCFVRSSCDSIQRAKKSRIHSEVESTINNVARYVGVARKNEMVTGYLHVGRKDETVSHRNKSDQNIFFHNDIQEIVMKTNRSKEVSSWFQRDARGSVWNVTTGITRKGGIQLEKNVNNCSEKMISYGNNKSRKAGYEWCVQVSDFQTNGSGHNTSNSVTGAPLWNSTKELKEVSLQTTEMYDYGKNKSISKDKRPAKKQRGLNNFSVHQSEEYMTNTNQREMAENEKTFTNSDIKSTVKGNKMKENEYHDSERSTNVIHVNGGVNNVIDKTVETNMSEIECKVLKISEQNTLPLSKGIKREKGNWKKREGIQKIREETEDNFVQILDPTECEEENEDCGEVVEKIMRKKNKVVGELVNEMIDVTDETGKEKEINNRCVNEFKLNVENLPEKVIEREFLDRNDLSEDEVGVKKKKIRQLQVSEEEYVKKNKELMRNKVTKKVSAKEKYMEEEESEKRMEGESNAEENTEEEVDNWSEVEEDEEGEEEEEEEEGEEEEEEEEENVIRRRGMQFLDIEAEEGEETEDEYEEEEEEDEDEDEVIEETDEENGVVRVEQFIDNEAIEENFLRRRKKRVQVIVDSEEEEIEKMNFEEKERLEKAMHIMNKLRKIIGHFKNETVKKLAQKEESTEERENEKVSNIGMNRPNAENLRNGVEVVEGNYNGKGEGQQQNTKTTVQHLNENMFHIVGKDTKGYKTEKLKYRTNVRVWGENGRTYASDPE